LNNKDYQRKLFTLRDFLQSLGKEKGHFQPKRLAHPSAVAITGFLASGFLASGFLSSGFLASGFFYSLGGAGLGSTFFGCWLGFLLSF